MEQDVDHDQQAHRADAAAETSEPSAYITEAQLEFMSQPGYRKDWAPLQAHARYGPGTSSHLHGNQERICEGANAVGMIQSYVFKPQLNENVVAAAIAIIPDEVRSREGDTVESLTERIASSPFFDDLLALKGGGRHGPKRVRLNETDYAQPRRKSWSAVVQLEEDGKIVCKMYAYGKKNSRIRTGVHAQPMPPAIGELGVQCFLSVRHVLSDVCASSPPNHCQLLGYYGLFDSKIGRHKDDHKLSTFYEVLLNTMRVEDAVNTSKGAMIPGADVLVYSTGPLPVMFAWCHATKNFPFVRRERYRIYPHMMYPLGHGTLFVFKAVDDLYFFHETWIDWREAKPSDYRFAFVFRWLGAQQLSESMIDSTSAPAEE